MSKRPSKRTLEIEQLAAKWAACKHDPAPCTCNISYRYSYPTRLHKEAYALYEEIIFGV